jgi:hypothetical protein
VISNSALRSLGGFFRGPQGDNTIGRAVGTLVKFGVLVGPDRLRLGYQDCTMIAVVVHPQQEVRVSHGRQSQELIAQL